MSCFAMRRDGELKPNNYNGTLQSEISTPKKAESNKRLPCMSSFIYLKRKRLNLSAVSTPQDCSPYGDKTTEGNEDCGHQSSFDTESHGANFDYHEPSQAMPHAPRHGFNRYVQYPKIVSQGHQASNDLDTDEKIAFYIKETTERACKQHRQDHGNVWLAPREDNYSCVQENRSTSKELECLDFMAPADCTRRPYASEQSFKSDYTHGEGQFYSLNTSTPHHSETWNFHPSKTSDQCEPLYQTTPSVIQYEHMSTSSASSSSSGFMAYSVTDGYGFSSNSSSEDEMRFVSETRNAQPNNSNNNFNFPWQGQHGTHAETEFQSSSDLTGVGMNAAGGMGYANPSELSSHFEATPESIPGGISYDFVSGSSWSWMNSDDNDNNDTENNDNNNNNNSNMTNDAVLVMDKCGRDASNLTSTSSPRNHYSPNLKEDANKGVKDDAIIDDDNDDGLKSKGRKTVLSYMALISKAILSSPGKRMLLSDIYDYLSQNYTDFKSNQRAWRNSVRHNLSLNECFVKQERLGRGRGHFWSIHPACVEDFIKGDFRRRQARRRAKKCSLGNDDLPVMRSSLPVEPSVAGHVDIVNFSRATDFDKAFDMQMSDASGKMAYHEIM